jgi:two-component system, chemotaxis family, sensor kinase Cph1
MSINGKIYDSEFCGSLPLHNINLIQPYGYLIVVDRSLSITQVSANADELFALPAQDLIQKNLSDFIEASEKERLMTRLSSGVTNKVPLYITIRNNEGAVVPAIAIVHLKNDFFVLEIEKSSQQNTFIDVYQEIRFSMAAIEQASSVKEVCEVAIRELRKLSGFNKVMMYRFDETWNGTVVAEASDHDLEPYLGLTFPASDIPKQARELYLKNSYRLIPTRDFNPVPLYPVRNPNLNAFLDLSDCNLRSVPTVHLEYLENMDVMASMSTRVIVDEKLWGLIACHHKTEKNLSYEERSMFELLSSVISAKIQSILSKEKFEFINKLREQRAKLVDWVYAENNIVKGLFHHEVTISDLLGANGAIISQNGNIESIGDVPDQNEIRNLVLWLQNKGVDRIFSESRLVDRYDHAANYTQIGSGIIAIPIDKERGDYIIAFRPEIITDVNWGGNPDEAINFESDGKKYHPRNSFRLWKETVVHTSAPWHSEEVVIAEEVRSFIFEFSSKYIYN